MNKRLSKERQALVLAALCEGTPINAVARMFRVGKHSVLRVIRETGEAFTDYMDANFRDLPCTRIEMDEQWQYVGIHSGRMIAPEKEFGDFWLWACIDADTKLVLSHRHQRKRCSNRTRLTGRSRRRRARVWRTCNKTMCLQMYGRAARQKRQLALLAL